MRGLTPGAEPARDPAWPPDRQVPGLAEPTVRGGANDQISTDPGLDLNGFGDCPGERLS